MPKVLFNLILHLADHLLWNGYCILACKYLACFSIFPSVFVGQQSKMLFVYLLLFCIAVSFSSVDLAVDYSDEPRRPTIKPFSSPKPTTILPFWTNVSTASAPVLLQIPDLATDSSTPVPDSSSKSAGKIHNYLSFLLLTIWYHLFIFYSFFFIFI